MSSPQEGIFSAPSGGPRANQNELLGFGEEAFLEICKEMSEDSFEYNSIDMHLCGLGGSLKASLCSVGEEDQDGEADWLLLSLSEGERGMLSIHPFDVCV